MVKSETRAITDEAELEKMFNPEQKITGGYIADKFVTPMPNDGGKAIIFKYSKDDDGTLCILKNVKNPAFDSGEAEIMTISEYEHPEAEYQIGASKSIKNAVKRMCTAEGWKFNELPGKVAQITANWYPAKKCSGVDKKIGCTGKNCPKCLGTEHSKVFNLRARHDLMSPTSQTKKKVADEF